VARAVPARVPEGAPVIHSPSPAEEMMRAAWTNSGRFDMARYQALLDRYAGVVGVGLLVPNTSVVDGWSGANWGGDERGLDAGEYQGA
jgi:hypothetical protein